MKSPRARISLHDGRAHFDNGIMYGTAVTGTQQWQSIRHSHTRQPPRASLADLMTYNNNKNNNNNNNGNSNDNKIRIVTIVRAYASYVCMYVCTCVRCRKHSSNTIRIRIGVCSTYDTHVRYLYDIYMYHVTHGRGQSHIAAPAWDNDSARPV